MLKAHVILAVATLTAVCAATGCRVESDSHGDNNSVKIATPFGGMQVKTNDSAVEAGIGLPLYPGATVEKKKDSDKGAADVNMSFGNFQLRVKAASYTTPDSPDKVMAFYRKALGRYGDVIECHNNHAVGSPARTAEGLTCDNDHENHISSDSGVTGNMELKAGSPQHQHIVAVDADGNGSKMGIVALDLPGHISIGDDKADDAHKE